MKTAVSLGLIFVGVWSIPYFVNPHAFGSSARTSMGFAILAAITTAGIGLLSAKPDAK